MIKIFYHLVDFAGWQDIAEEQLLQIEASGLMSQSEIYMNMHYNESSFDNLKEKWNSRGNFIWVFKEGIDPKEHDVPTGILMKEVVDATTDEYPILYLHLKGVTHIGKPTETKTIHWRWVLDYWAIDHWQECVGKLQEGYDGVGCNYRSYPWHHLSGNLGWTKASFIRQCRALVLPSTVNYQRQTNNNYNYTCDMEAWWGHNGARFYGMHESGVDHYQQEYPPERYKK